MVCQWKIREVFMLACIAFRSMSCSKTKSNWLLMTAYHVQCPRVSCVYILLGVTLKTLCVKHDMKIMLDD